MAATVVRLLRNSALMQLALTAVGIQASLSLYIARILKYKRLPHCRAHSWRRRRGRRRATRPIYLWTSPTMSARAQDIRGPQTQLDATRVHSLFLSRIGSAAVANRCELTSAQH